MKRFLFLVCLSMIACISAIAQKKFNNEQMKLRNDIKSFLYEEGFMPEIDSEGDIAFKKEGDKYYVIMDDRDTSPFYITLSKFYKYGGQYNKQKIADNLEELNLKKAVKVVLFDNNYAFQAEMFLVNADSFKYVFYKLMKQLEVLQDDLVDVCSGTNSNGNSYTGTLLVNEDFSSYSSAWIKSHSDGKLSFKDGKMTFEDLAASGYSVLTYNLPKNLKNEDFKLNFSMKTTFKKKYSSIFFILGTKWNNSYSFGFCTWDDVKIVLSSGTFDDSKKYYGYSDDANLKSYVTNQYTIVKKGNKIEWYANGILIFSKTVDLSIDMNLMGFLVPDRHKVEIDYLTINLI